MFELRAGAQFETIAIAGCLLAPNGQFKADTSFQLNQTGTQLSHGRIQSAICGSGCFLLWGFPFDGQRPAYTRVAQKRRLLPCIEWCGFHIV